MNPFTFARRTPQNNTPDASELSPESLSERPGRLPWQTDEETGRASQADLSTYQHSSRNVWHVSQPEWEESDPRILAMERDEPKRRLIRNAKALGKLRKITQAQMAEEIGVPCRTLHEWLQFRRVPKAPGTTLLRRWIEAHPGDHNHY